MAFLPWQVTHGSWVGWSVGATVVALGVLLLWLWVRRHARITTARARKSMGAASVLPKFPTQGALVLRGRIEVLGTPVPALDGRGSAAVCTVDASARALRWKQPRSRATRSFRAPALRLATPDGALTVTGPVRVALGSAQTFIGQLSRLSRYDRDHLVRPPEEGETGWRTTLKVPGVVRSIRHGDEVLLRGVVRQSRTSGYHDAPPLEMVPESDSEPIRMVAAGETSLFFGKVALLVRGVLVGVSLAVGLAILGGFWFSRIEDYRSAALFPHLRRNAIRQLRKEAESDPSRKGRPRVETVLAFDHYAPACEDTARELFAHGRFQQAAERLTTCGNPSASRQAAMAWAMVAEFDKAGALLETAAEPTGEKGRQEASLFLLAGRLRSASLAIRRYVDWYGTHGKGPGPDKRKRIVALNCAADALDARSGDQIARKRLRAGKAEACRLARADLLDGPERAKALAYLSEASPNQRQRHQHPLLRDVLSLSSGGRLGYWPQPALPDNGAFRPVAILSGHIPVRAHALEARGLKTLVDVKEPSPEQRSFRRVLAVRAALFELASGDVPAAHRWLDLAENDTLLLVAKDAAELDQELSSRRYVSRARSVALRALVHLFADPKKALSSPQPWRDLSPQRFLGDQLDPLDEKNPLNRAVAAYRTLPHHLRRVSDEVVPVFADMNDLLTLSRDGTVRDPGLFWTPRTSSPPPPPILKLESGEAAVEFFESRKELSPSGPVLLLLVHRIRAGQQTLATWLAYGRYERPLVVGVKGMFDATARARLADALGASDLAAQNRAIAQRYRAALSRPEIAVPWKLLAE